MTIEIPATPAESAAVDVVFEVVRADAVLTGRAMSSGQYLAGLIANAQLETVGTPDKLPADQFPDDDPAVVQRVWDRALAVGFHMGRSDASSSRFQEDKLARGQELLVEAGFHAMAGTVGRSRGLVERARQAHPVDREIAREH